MTTIIDFPFPVSSHQNFFNITQLMKYWHICASFFFFIDVHWEERMDVLRLIERKVFTHTQKLIQKCRTEKLRFVEAFLKLHPKQYTDYTDGESKRTIVPLHFDRSTEIWVLRERTSIFFPEKNLYFCFSMENSQSKFQSLELTNLTSP